MPDYGTPAGGGGGGSPGSGGFTYVTPEQLKELTEKQKVDRSEIDNLKKEKIQSVEIISTISAVIALVLVFTQTAIQFTHVWQAYVVLAMGTCSLLIFANLIHKFFGSTEEKRKTPARPTPAAGGGYWRLFAGTEAWLRASDPLITVPFIFIGVIGILSFITYIRDNPVEPEHRSEYRRESRYDEEEPYRYVRHRQD